MEENGIYAVEIFKQNGCTEIPDAYEFIASDVNNFKILITQKQIINR
jgi:hypothetical protein